MKRTTLALIIAAITTTAFANSDMSELSSTADAPNNLYDFIENDKLSGVAYGGAELGTNVLFGDQKDAKGKDANLDNWNMFKVGADFTYKASESIDILIGGEARYAWGGIDTLDAQNYVDRFTFGVNTAAGKTTFGKQCGVADVYLGFADISKEHGLGAEADEVACSSEQLNHHFYGNNFDLGVSYEHQNDAWAVGGSFNAGPIVVGGTYVDIDHGDANTGANMGSGKDMSETVYTLGAVMQINQLNLAAKYAYAEEEMNGGETAEITGYAFGAGYQATTNLSLAVTYNYEDYNTAVGKSFDSDDWFTLGASYRLNEHVELVTDYKAASEEDDKLFLRANVSF